MIAHPRKPIQYYSQVGQFQHAKDNHNCEERERERDHNALAEDVCAIQPVL